jgi:hypothetical protein
MVELKWMGKKGKYEQAIFELLDSQGNKYAVIGAKCYWCGDAYRASGSYWYRVSGRNMVSNSPYQRHLQPLALFVRRQVQKLKVEPNNF